MAGLHKIQNAIYKQFLGAFNKKIKDTVLNCIYFNLKFLMFFDFYLAYTYIHGRKKIYFFVFLRLLFKN